MGHSYVFFLRMFLFEHFMYVMSTHCIYFHMQEKIACKTYLFHIEAIPFFLE
jgi:hypothetical protein